MVVRKRLRELKEMLHKDDYTTLLAIVREDIKFHKKIGTKYTIEKVLDVINTSFVVVKRTCQTCK